MVEPLYHDSARLQFQYQQLGSDNDIRLVKLHRFVFSFELPSLVPSLDMQC